MSFDANRLVTRWAHRGDALALGTLARDILADAPSSEVALQDVCPDPREFGEQLLAGVATMFVIQTPMEGIVGGARIVPREFIRASHVAEITLGVQPRFRRRGVGTVLLSGLEAVLEGTLGLSKAVVRVASDDVALTGLLERSSAGWAIERCEYDALFRDERYIDLHLHALHIPFD